ncbi:MAG: SIS domain-containing protein, partial [Candidatus Atribacteria bacterium]|nr:SIS domain-containing protein [Candidatus Atribacteria bacterium]
MEIKDFNGNVIKKEISEIEWDTETLSKDGFKHYMLKEIFQETMIIHNNLEGRIDFSKKQLIQSAFTFPQEKIKDIQKIFILACGTSYYAALVAKYAFEELTGLPVEVDYASEFRYRKVLLTKRDLTIVISQSGETADTISAINVCKAAGSHVMAITNVRGSTISRKVDSVMYIKAGPEIGVASTKAF